MANGRMITNLICRDKRVNQLVNDTSRLAFTWLITFADREGRTPGDPAVVRSMVFPRRQDVTIEQMEAYISEWHALGLVVWYEADDDKWIWFPSFDKNQQGLRKDREAPSKIPQPPALTPDLIRTDDGVVPDQIPVKLREENVKLNEVEGNENDPAEIKEPAVPIKPELQLLYTVTGLQPGYMDEEQAIQKVRTIHNKRRLQGDDLTAYLKEVYAAWCAAKTADGRLYNPSNWAWLDWAVTGYKAAPAKQPAANVPTQEDYEREKAEKQAIFRAARAAHEAQNGNQNHAQ